MKRDILIEVVQCELKQVLQLRIVPERLQVLQRQLVEEEIDLGLQRCSKEFLEDLELPLSELKRAELVEVEDLFVETKELLALHDVGLTFKEVEAKSADPIKD